MSEHCQTNLNGPAKGADLRHSSRQLTPFGQGGRTVLFEDVAAVEVAAVEQGQMPCSTSITHARSKSSPVPSATFATQSANSGHSQCLNNDLACVLFVYLPQVLLEWPRLCDFRFRGCLGAGQNLEPDLEINKR